MTFSSLGLSQDLIDAVKVAGYDAPTSVQEKAIPLILQGRDLIAQARTGTGKTASFALPVLQLMQSSASGQKRTIRALVLASSRELAMQVERGLKAYGRQLTYPLRTIALTEPTELAARTASEREDAEVERVIAANAAARTGRARR